MPKEIIKQIVDTGSDQSAPVKAKWWTESDDDVYRSVFAVVKRIEGNQNYRRTENLKFAKLYHNQELLGFNLGTYNRSTDSNDRFPLRNRVTLNVIKSCVDTASAKIAKNKPRAYFLTSNGDYSLQRKAKLLTKYLDGLFESTNAYELGQRTFVDACVFGTGALKVFAEDNRVKLERVFIDELIVDDAEGIYGTPRQIHQRKYVFRDVLLDLFPDFEEQIVKCQAAASDSTSAADTVQVVESWHLPSGANAGDGKHTICIENQTLFSEEYKKDYFPFVIMRWTPRLQGFWGEGLAHELVGVQIEINKLLKNISLAQHLMAVPRIFIENASMVNPNAINNEIGAIIKYTGQPPTFSVAPAMPSEVYQHLENLYRKAYEITGISQLSASSRKPAGLESAVALREFQDIETERFILTGQRYERFYMDLARKMIDISRDLYSAGNDLKLNVKAKKFIQTINWKDVSLDDDQFEMQMFPVSMLPRTPAGKLQMVQELVAAGFVNPQAALGLLDFPDLDEFTNLQTAALDDIRYLIEQMLDEGKYTPPDEFMDLNTAMKMVQATYLRVKDMAGIEPERIDMLQTFMQQIIELQNPPQPPHPDMAGQPIANPEAPPTSDLMPVMPQGPVQ